MSSFSGLNTALSGLTAQRQALNVVGQNLANVNTPGYTRQRANLEPVESSPHVGLLGTGSRSGGVKVGEYERLGDQFLETRARQETAVNSRLNALATTWSRMETALQEPGSAGLSAQLHDFFTSWSDIGNDSKAAMTARAVLYEKANSLITRMQSDYVNVRTQWDTLRTQTESRVSDINVTAQAIADLNARIRSTTAVGENPNDLIDQRAVLAQTLAQRIGGEARERADGTMDIMVGGNALVRGSTVSKIALTGSTQMTNIEGNPVRLVWAESGRPVDPTSGEVKGYLESLAPASEGGVLAGLAENYNKTALSLAKSVNDLHKSALTTTGDPGGAFFTDFPAGYTGEAVLDLKVVVADSTKIAVAAPGKGPLDATIADQISQISETGKLWADVVAEIGTQSGAAADRAKASGVTLVRAQQDLLAGTGVDSDEETMNLLMYQRGYEASARLMTTIDEMLDLLINRTGVVGR